MEVKPTARAATQPSNSSLAAMRQSNPPIELKNALLVEKFSHVLGRAQLEDTHILHDVGSNEIKTLSHFCRGRKHPKKAHSSVIFATN